eukprot:COSAG04_NODE_1168_length_7978_cov_4.222998_7_plen_76_part_00
MPTALAVCSQAAAEGDAPHSSKALLEPSDLSVRAYMTPPSTAARPSLAGRRPTEQERSMRAPPTLGGKEVFSRGV